MCGLREGAQLILPSVKDDGKEDIIRHYENLLDLNVLRGVAMRRPPGGQGPLFAQFQKTGSLSRVRA